MRFRFLLPGFSLWFIPAAISVSHAGISMDLGGSVLRSSQGQGTTETTDLRTMGMGSLSYVFPQGFGIGIETLGLRESQRSSLTWAVGPRGAFVYRGFELAGAYFPLSENIQGVSRLKGGGFALSARYRFKVIGPLSGDFGILYWANGFTELNGVDLTQSQHSSFLSPTLGLAFGI